MHPARSHLKLAGSLLAGTLVLAACGGGGSDDPGGDATTAPGDTGDTTTAPGDTGDPGTSGETGDTGTSGETGTSDTGTSGDDGGPTPGAGGTIHAASIGWAEDVAVNALWTELLAERGYEWTSTPAEVGAIYTGVADGDFDLFMDAWLPGTHSDYWDSFGDQIDDLTVWYDEAPLWWTVPTYVVEEHGITSLADLADNADLFDSTIQGIDAGAGLMRISMDSVMPTYGLEDWTLIEANEQTMLTELDKAIGNQEPIVVTLWEPHSAYSNWDVTNLEDPEGALGEPDQIHTIVRQGFEEDFPEVAGWLSNFTMTSDQISSLELAIEQGGEGGESEAVQGWIAENQDAVDAWFG